ncbi:MAG: MraY family glycosyltransferase [Candidatus Promineifilaceae bacterium]|nr:MraY family glycosyltransferase [Candidatus Promineifilaceae bacterium]
MEFVLVLALAFGVSLVLGPASRTLAQRRQILARPGGRRQHPGPVAKLGGLPLMAGYLVGIGLVYWLLPPQGDDALRLRGVLLGSLLVFGGGLIDDRWELSPWAQFTIQFAGATVAMAHIVFIEVFTNPLTGEAVWIQWRPLALLVTALWIVGLINTVNWLDGLDGLAAGVGTIAALLFAWHSYRLGQGAVAAFPVALAGALLGFLPYNFAKASLFLGTAGAYLLGFNLATLAILSPAKIATALLVMAVPIIDGLWRVIDRLRRGRSPFFGDRGHLHFRLADEGVPPRVIVLGYYAVSLAFGLVAIFATGLLKLVFLLMLGVIVLALLVWLSFRGEAVGR